MVRGERDYTQRVVAITRPSGIIGGRIIYLEDFESLPTHSELVSGDFSVCTSGSGLWQGDGSGQYAISVGVTDAFEIKFPVPTADVIGAEMVFRPVSTNLNYARLYMVVHDGTYVSVIGVQLIYDPAGAKLQVFDDTANWTTIRTYASADIPAYWHVIYMRFNLGTGLYEVAQLDGTRISIATQAFSKTTSGSTPYALAQAGFTAKAAQTETVNFDDLILVYEEL